MLQRASPQLPRALGAIIAVLALATGAAAKEPVGRHVPHEVLIELAPNVPERAVTAMARRLQLDRIASSAGDMTVSRWRIRDSRPVPAVLRSLAAERIVMAAQPNYIYGLQ